MLLIVYHTLVFFIHVDTIPYTFITCSFNVSKALSTFMLSLADISKNVVFNFLAKIFPILLGTCLSDSISNLFPTNRHCTSGEAC